MLRKPKILVVGSYVMDLIASAPRVPNMGETVIGTDFRTAPGGKGANQAVQCARLGALVTMTGCVGDDAFGREMLDTATASGVDVSRTRIVQGCPTGVGHIQLQTSPNGTQNRILVVPGANHAFTVEDLSWLSDEVSQYDLVMLQLELPMAVTKYVAKCAHQAGVPVMLNPAPAADLDDELLSCLSYLSPNEHEAALLTGLPLRADDNGVNMEDLNQLSEALRSRGTGKVIITLGGNGSAVCGEDGTQLTACVKMPEVLDPTAAGDSFVAAFCTGITAGLPEKEALAFASHTAAITVSRMGAMPSLPTIEEVQALLRDRGYTGFDAAELDALKE